MTKRDWIAIAVCLSVIAYFCGWVLYDHLRARRRIREAGELPRLTVKLGVRAGAAASGFRTFADQLAKMSLYMRHRGPGNPEFAVLDLMRWAWPTWRVQTRPFDWRVD